MLICFEYCLWLLLRYKYTVVHQRLHSLQNLQYVLFGASQKKCSDFCSGCQSVVLYHLYHVYHLGMGLKCTLQHPCQTY